MKAFRFIAIAFASYSLFCLGMIALFWPRGKR